MSMDKERKRNIEKYIQDWYWDKKSQKFAFELCTYLFDFMDYLDKESGLSEKSLSKHHSNCGMIGILICQYGYQEKFNGQVFAYPPYHDLDFERKMSSSKHQIQSYNSTCNKLEKYALQKGDLVYDD